MNAVIKESIDSYSDLLEETLTVHGLMSSPGQLYNMDESGVALNYCPPEDRKTFDIELQATRTKSQ